jgi:putative phosphoserine phosphatase/1-acylglycerol-3-phosphate O-acyltransferase
LLEYSLAHLIDVLTIVWGTTKATSVQRFAADHQINLRSSYFYADGDEDLALMHLVGHPQPTNPGPALTKVADRRGWPILRFSSRGSGGPLARVRPGRGWFAVLDVSHPSETDLAGHFDRHARHRRLFI